MIPASNGIDRSSIMNKHKTTLAALRLVAGFSARGQPRGLSAPRVIHLAMRAARTHTSARGAARALHASSQAGEQATAL